MFCRVPLFRESCYYCISSISERKEKTSRTLWKNGGLVEGTSINSTCRMTGVAKHTVLKLLKDMGCACAAYHDANVRNLRVRRIQADEIWAFVYGKDKNLTIEQVQAGAGSVWTWTALDADTKLIVSYILGDRGAATAQSFMRDVAGRIANRIQLTTDGHRVYAEAVEGAFGADIDYAMLVKIYGASKFAGMMDSGEPSSSQAGSGEQFKREEKYISLGGMNVPKISDSGTA
jgi:IS1 family transposase